MSEDGRKWVEYSDKRTDDPPKKLKVGLFASSTSRGPLKVTFDRLKLAPLRPKKE